MSTVKGGSGRPSSAMPLSHHQSPPVASPERPVSAVLRPLPSARLTPSQLPAAAPSPAPAASET
eukprot:2609667-Prymnesium_polylepis.1